MYKYYTARVLQLDPQSLIKNAGTHLHINGVAMRTLTDQHVMGHDFFAIRLKLNANL
jgi:hypothetical protein